MEYKVITSSHASGLTEQVNKAIAEGWEVEGSHKVVAIHEQNRYAGSQHMDTVIKSEYSQTLIKK